VTEKEVSHGEKGQSIKTMNYYYQEKLIHWMMHVCILVLLLIFFDLPAYLRLMVSAIGLYAGLLVGKKDWKTTASGIDERNKAIIHDDGVDVDGIFSFLVILLILYFVRSSYPASKLLHYLVWLIQSITLFFVAMACGSNYLIYSKARKYEVEHGKLVTEGYWNRSPVGKEGMIDQKGIAIEDCNPLGKVRVNSEIWKAESMDGKLIKQGTEITVRDINGLQLMIEESGARQ
jgi:membrane protein implicated in regulation of membrane protease activity